MKHLLYAKLVTQHLIYLIESLQQLYDEENEAQIV